MRGLYSLLLFVTAANWVTGQFWPPFPTCPRYQTDITWDADKISEVSIYHSVRIAKKKLKVKAYSKDLATML